MLVACMGGNAYTRIGNPADVETIQSRYTYLTPGAGELTDGPQRPYGQRVQGVSQEQKEEKERMPEHPFLP